jgi:hypothetical protein
MRSEIVLSLPFTGRWLAQNSPARRIPSHGTDLLGERYAIDFVAVDHHRRTADRRDWRTFLATEPAERFLAFGQPILAPAAGTVIAAHDGAMAFQNFREWPRGTNHALVRESGLPGEGAVVEPLSLDGSHS